MRVVSIPMEAMLTVLLWSLVAACSSYPWAPLLRDPPPGREQLESIAVVFESAVGAPRVQRPMGPAGGVAVGSLAGAGVGVYAAAAVAMPVREAKGLAVFLWVATAAVTVPVCTIGGALIGGFRAMPKAEAARRMATIERAFVAAPPGLGLDLATRAALSRARPEVMLVDAAVADALVNVRLTGYGLLGRGGIDPEVAVVVEVETSWTAAGVAHRFEWQYRGPTRRLTAWSDATYHIGDELRRARESLALRIAEELLLVEVPR